METGLRITMLVIIIAIICCVMFISAKTTEIINEIENNNVQQSVEKKGE